MLAWTAALGQER